MNLVGKVIRWSDGENTLVGLANAYDAVDDEFHISPQGLTHAHIWVPASKCSEVIYDPWEYTITTGPRKAWSDYDIPPEGNGWELDPDRGVKGESWERFDFHEERYWRRLKDQ